MCIDLTSITYLVLKQVFYSAIKPVGLQVNLTDKYLKVENSLKVI